MNPSDEKDLHEFYLMTDDLELEIRSLARRAFSCGGGTLGLYQPRHQRP